ncbi:PQ loop repeat protein [mine drainage metagenome]|uniref:PQ loop repeat protein n=1 Tax=mine drainage metagenome TaxID=410659 RepID=A0A1J5RB35_9ZZZZ
MTVKDAADAVGALAGLLTTVAFLPQVIKTWKSRSAADLSLGMFAILCAGVALWLLYGLLLGVWPVILANAATLLLAGAILAMKLMRR